MLPSLLGSLDCGFRYALMVGYDAGDFLFDDPTGVKEREVLQWIDTHIVDVAQQNGIQISPYLIKVNNPLAKPGPVFNVLTKRAFLTGADYVYRCVGIRASRITPHTAFRTPRTTHTRHHAHHTSHITHHTPHAPHSG